MNATYIKQAHAGRPPVDAVRDRIVRGRDVDAAGWRLPLTAAPSAQPNVRRVPDGFVVERVAFVAAVPFRSYGEARQIAERICLSPANYLDAIAAVGMEGVQDLRRPTPPPACS